MRLKLSSVKWRPFCPGDDQLTSSSIAGRAIVPFHKDFSPSGDQLEHRQLAHEL